MTAWVFEARHCPTLLNEIKKTKLQIYTSPQAGINILLTAGPVTALSLFTQFTQFIHGFDCLVFRARSPRHWKNKNFTVKVTIQVSIEPIN